MNPLTHVLQLHNITGSFEEVSKPSRTLTTLNAFEIPTARYQLRFLSMHSSKTEFSPEHHIVHGEAKATPRTAQSKASAHTKKPQKTHHYSPLIASTSSAELHQSLA